jgi:methionine synthase I (cobalamin-dependent)/5,10-methylenetetrahydrofolate reductase
MESPTGVHSFLARLAQGPILCDGGMGTQLYAHGVAYERGFESQNLANTALVERVHRAYLSAGAEILETNTFGANRLKLAPYGLGGSVNEICRAGARIARNAREVSGIDSFIAGSVGPLGCLLAPYGDVTLPQARGYFREMIDGLVKGGVDLIMLETFLSLEEIAQAIAAAREVSELPVVAQLSFTGELLTPSGQTPEAVAVALDHLGVDVIGTNCSVGPQSTLEIIERMAAVTRRPLSAQPNAGLPQRMAGRLLFLSSAEYFADYSLRLVRAGARLVGGCCGTTPAHIAAMAAALKGPTSPEELPDRDPVVIDLPASDGDAGALVEQSALEVAFQRGMAISVELSPPRGANAGRMLAGARLLKDAGVDALNITDGAMARVRMSTLASGSLVRQNVGIDPVLHVTTRDRNLMALQSDLLGAHALGLRVVLALTGDPPNLGDSALAKGVYDIDSIGLIRMLHGFNNGVDAAGNAIGQRTSFLIGAALNPTAPDLDCELDRFARKLEAGAHFVMTQPVYDADLFSQVLDRIGPLHVPLLLGLMPLQSFRNAEFVHNELPGVRLTDQVLARMRKAGAQGHAEGLAISLDLLSACVHRVSGVYIIPTFQRYEPAAELVRLLRANTRAR